MPKILTSTGVLLGLLVTVACNKSDHPIARVNGQPITQSRWDAYLKFKHVRADNQASKASALDDYVVRAGLAEVIEGEKLLDPKLTQAELDEFKKEMLLSRYFEKFLEDKVTDKAIQNYYETHAADYEEQKVHVAHILFRLNPKQTEEERKARLTAAQAAYSQLRTGKDFAGIASELSEDKVSAKNGGDLGWIRGGSVDPAFSKRAFELKAGEVSEPFETPFGFHIVKVLEAAQVIKKPLRAVQGDIRYQLRAEAKAAEMARLLAKTELEIDGKPRKAPSTETPKPDTRRADRR
jgi:peptidyl-prolyl cis-trans isomerase C